jgi:hypothetical protein
MKSLPICNHAWIVREQYTQGYMESDTKYRVTRFQCLACNTVKEERVMVEEDQT